MRPEQAAGLILFILNLTYTAVMVTVVLMWAIRMVA